MIGMVVDRKAGQSCEHSEAMMADPALVSRLALVVNQFSYKYSDGASSGALAQLWTVQTEPCGRRVLTTQGSPYSIMGVSDHLALYRYCSSKYRPSCDGANPACAIGRVYANLQPELSGDVGQVHKEFDRQSEAQRCNIHSNLLLAIYDDTLEQPCPVAVFELAQHEVNVDFSNAVNILHCVAKEHGFWVPQLESARNVDSCEVPLDPLPGTTSATSSSSSGGLGSMNAAVSALMQKVRSCTPTPPGCHHAAGARRRGRAVRRSSCLIAEPPHSIPEEAELQQQQQQGPQQQQQQQCGGQGRAPRNRRQSVIVTDHYQFDAAAAAGARCRNKRSFDLGDPDNDLFNLGSGGSSSSSTLPAGSSPGPEQQQQQQQQQVRSSSSGGRQSYDHSSFNPRSSSSGGRHPGFDPCAVAESLRRAATPPLEPCASRQGGTWGHSRLASSAGLPQQQQQQQALSSSASVPQPPLQPHQPPPQWASHTGVPAGPGGSRLSPFQCGALPAAPHRSFTPPHHPHRHIVDASHTARAVSLQLQAMMGTAAQQQEFAGHQQQWQQQQQHDGDRQRQRQQQRDSQQRDQQQQWQQLKQQPDRGFSPNLHQQQQKQHLDVRSAESRSSSSEFASPFHPSRRQQQQQEEWHDPFAAASVRSPSFGTVSSGGSSSAERVRALVALGGSFRHVGLGGMWEYVGGAQKLVGVPRAAGMAELAGQLAHQAHAAQSQCKIKYALPGTTGATTYVDLETQEDVEMMWDEWDDYTTSHKGVSAKLQLYVEAGGSSSTLGSASCSDSGRGSGGSDTSTRFGLTPGLTGGSSNSLQPDTPVHTSPASSRLGPGTAAGAAAAGSSAASSAAGVAARLASMSLLSISSSAPAAAAAAPASHQESIGGQEGITLVPFYSGQLPGQAGAAGGARTPGLPGAGGDALGLPPGEESEQFVTCFDTAELHTASNSPALAAQAHAAPDGAGAADGSGTIGPHSSSRGQQHGSSSSSAASAWTHSSSSSSMSSCPPVQGVQSGGSGSVVPPVAQPMDVLLRQKKDQLKQLVSELEGRVEVMMPWELNIVRFLGGGAFGEVYLATWHGTQVAAKCLAPSLITSDHSSSGTPCADAVAELMKEAAMLASLHHPNIVAVFGVVLPPSNLLSPSSSNVSELAAGRLDSYEFAHDDELAADAGHHYGPGRFCGSMQQHGHPSADCKAASGLFGRPALSEGHPPAPAVVTEYLAAGSLRAAIGTRAEWLKSSMTKAKLMLDTARGLDYLHGKRFVHFDLKSANLLVTMKDKIPCCKVADFGLTKQRRQTYVTGVNSLRGTLPWIAPEIIKCPESVTEKADIYSFGVILWELWTYQEPFEGVHLHALLHQLTSPGGLSLPVPGSADWGEDEAPPEPAPGWAALMQRCWLPPAERPTSRQLVAALEDILEALRSVRRRSGADAAAGSGGSGGHRS